MKKKFISKVSLKFNNYCCQRKQAYTLKKQKKASLDFQFLKSFILCFNFIYLIAMEIFCFERKKSVDQNLLTDFQFQPFSLIKCAIPMVLTQSIISIRHKITCSALRKLKNFLFLRLTQNYFMVKILKY